MRYALAWIAALGCTSASRVGTPCSAKDPCGDGAICDLTAPDGNPVCLDAAGDLDGDGLPNGKDFCEHAAGGQFDEDGDGIGDDCDRCPIAPPPTNPDPDGDDVDSPCDPDPRTAGDQILLFDGFSSGALGAQWTATTPGAWQVVGGELIVSLGSLASEDYLKAFVTANPNLAVLTSYRVDTLEPSTGTHIVAVVGNDPTPAGVANFECGVVHSDIGGNEVVDLETNVNVASHPAVQAFDSARLYEAAAYSTGNQVGCTVIADAAALGTVQAPITPDALSKVAIGARGVTARFQWILVVGRSN